MAEIEQLELELKSRQICQDHLKNKLQFLNQVKETCQGMIYRIEKMPDINRAANAQRYFKRASNQLIKALKRL